MQYIVPDLSLDTQLYIATILSVLDKRIATNKKINHNLEQIAQTIFENWFVDFEPWDGEQPSDWQKDVLGKFVDIKRGGSPRPIQEFMSNTGFRWLKISDVTALQTPFVLEIKEHIKEEGLRKTVFRKSGSLVLSNSATPGIPKILCVDTCIHDGWIYFPCSLFSNEYLYLFFKCIRQNLVTLGNGSIFTNLKTDILKNYVVSVPDEQTLQKFDEIVKPLFKTMENYTRESVCLANLRDVLLSRLMSGELSTEVRH
ncbi:MAG: restriction endonuclease subunit S [Oscillospiraceae bacterium]|nr:restriction endonuclease subunit S [Oscillospiraceae bacterium]